MMKKKNYITKKIKLLDNIFNEPINNPTKILANQIQQYTKNVSQFESIIPGLFQ